MCRLIIAVSFVGVLLTGCTKEQPQIELQTKSLPSIHPVFNTPISGASTARPAILVDVLDESEGWFNRAELYLSVQSSRFPSNTRILLPVNIGDFEGCRSRFVQLPFEVEAGDTLAFNLLEDDVLTEEDQEKLLIACRLTGYCVVVGIAVYSPDSARLAAPLVTQGAELLGEAVIEAIKLDEFDNYGTAEYIVQDGLPDGPSSANRLTLLRDTNYAHVQLRIYGPPEPLSEFTKLSRPTSTALLVTAKGDTQSYFAAAALVW